VVSSPSYLPQNRCAGILHPAEAEGDRGGPGALADSEDGGGMISVTIERARGEREECRYAPRDAKEQDGKWRFYAAGKLAGPQLGPGKCGGVATVN
jgi:hypothetical protein